MNCRIFSIGDDALTIEFGNEISFELNNFVINLTDALKKFSFRGFREIIPAYASLTVFYDVVKVRKSYPQFPTAFAAVKHFIEERIGNSYNFLQKSSRLVKIPVCFDPEFALDLDFVASKSNLSYNEAVSIFLNKTYRIFMLGFLPGFAYMGELDARIAMPRKVTPRLQVPPGSVGLAGRQTGIYPFESPGGWQIIGKTPAKLFMPESVAPVFLQAGDNVKFYQIEKKAFLDEKFKIEIEK